MSEEEALRKVLRPDGVLFLTMNRPEVHNAFDDRQIRHLVEALEEAKANDNVRVVVLASTGKSFSAGGDIDYMRRMGENTYEENLEDAGQLARLMKSLNFLPKPTIARVQGAAMGGGVGLVCCCDFAIGSPRALFATSEVRLGMVAATISPYVAATVGEKASRRMFTSGLPVSAEQALNLGLLSDVVPEEDLDTAVDTLAGTLLKNAPEAVRLSKQLAFDVSSRPISDELISDTVRLIAQVRDSDEGREGLSAFLEKRAPIWMTED
jgi:methylglutaconyl-CoA hydratase